MSKQIKKSAVASADTKELRALAATAGIKFIGKKIDDLRGELMNIAVDDKAKPAKKAKKEPEAKPAKKAKKETVKKEAVKKERVAVSAKDASDIAKLDTKKAKVITLRERNYSIHSIAEAVDLHPTNVSRYIREAGLSTSTATVPKERIDRIKATIAGKKKAAAPVKAATKAAAPKAAPVVKKEDKKEAKKAKVTVAAKPPKKGRK